VVHHQLEKATRRPRLVRLSSDNLWNSASRVSQADTQSPDSGGTITRHLQERKEAFVLYGLADIYSPFQMSPELTDLSCGEMMWAAVHGVPSVQDLYGVLCLAVAPLSSHDPALSM
jgi:hypothetical protein